jgi:dolichol-phosphate mannosyltransferase
VIAPLPRVSVAIPVFNEADGVAELLRRVGDTLRAVPGGPHEIVIVNDGSGDDTLARLAQHALTDDRVVIVSLSRNFGHQAALTAALDHVTGDVAIVMDGDLQDPPELIPDLLALHASGHDVVYARRSSRKEPWWLRASYFLFYRLLDRLSTVRVPLDSGDFGLLSRRVVDQLRRMPEHHRFLRGMRTWVGFRQTAIAVDRDERHTGTSKFTFRKLLGLAFDGIFAFSIVPIRAAALLGALVISLSALFGGYAVWAKLFMHESPRGFTALTLLITFLSGVQLFFLGVIGEYVGRVYEQSKGRPIYVVDQIIGRDAPVDTGRGSSPRIAAARR